MANNNHFDLTLDTLAPSGSITRVAEYMNANGTLTIVTGGATFMYIWFDSTPVPTEIPETAEKITAATSYTTKFVDEGSYFYHLVLVDDLENKSAIYSTESMFYDTTKPVINSVSINDGAEYTTSRDVTLTFTFTDTGSRCKSYTLSGDLADSVAKTGIFTTEDITAGSKTLNIILSGTGAEKKEKSITVVVDDNAGNISESASDTIILDTEFLTGDIVLKDITDTKTINGQWVNTADVKIKLTLGSATSNDVVGYKVWGDINLDGSKTATTEPTDFTSITKGTNPIEIDMKFTSGDAEIKTISAKVIDDAGNITTLTDASAKVDYSAPEVSISAQTKTNGYVSEQTDYNIVTITPTVDATISGVKSYTLRLDDTDTTITGTTIPETITFNASDMGTDGKHIFTLKVTDNAENITISNGIEIVKDTVAPTGTVTMSGWANASTYPALGATASATDESSSVETMQCWCSAIANDTTEKGTVITYSVNPTHSQIDWTDHAESANNYIHIKYTDAVGNSSYAHSDAFGIDTVLPDNGSIKFTKAAYSSVSAAVNIQSTDITSGISEMLVTGDFTGSATAEWESYATVKNVTLTEGDGEKTISIRFKDAAGNISASVVSDTCELDTKTPSLIATLFEPDDKTKKATISNVDEFIVHFTGHDDQGTPYSADNLQYKIWGDFNTVSGSIEATVEPDNWADVIFETGKSYMKLSGLYATKDQSVEGEGQVKTIYIKVKDNADNEISVTISFILDQTAPVVTVSNIDYNSISKIHSERRTIDYTAITDKYADEVTFKFTPDTKMKAYKVCAYTDQTAADAGNNGSETKKYSECASPAEKDAWVELQNAIQKTNGSINMYGISLESKETVESMIKGADFEIALGGASETGERDGAHIIVVYVQDLSGTWSEAAKFNV